MTSQTRIMLYCDGTSPDCQQREPGSDVKRPFLPDEASQTVRVQRREAAFQGWSYIPRSGSDYCPSCTRERKAQNRSEPMRRCDAKSNTGYQCHHKTKTRCVWCLDAMCGVHRERHVPDDGYGTCER